jgi:hypothetical protein
MTQFEEIGADQSIAGTAKREKTAKKEKRKGNR